MLLKKSILTALLFTFTVVKSYSQTTENWLMPAIDSITNSKYNNEKNKLENTHSLFSLLTKLYRIKHFSNEKAVIVHIGDSHIQADMMTSSIRSSFQNYYGNAGRGLLFPFQIAKSNAPSDIISKSKDVWKSSRITRLDTIVSSGIGAFGLQSLNRNAEINLELRTINGVKETFNKVSLFYGDTIKELQLETDSNELFLGCFDTPNTYFSTTFNKPTSSLKIGFPNTDSVKFYGALVEKENVGGVIYNSIGANGAKYSDYNKTSLFWKQLPNLNADCYVISLGTNEAQDQNLSENAFLEPVKIMVNRLKLISPNAAIIITTPPVSYYKKMRPNKSLEVITNAIIKYCNENNLVYWDLFTTSEGSEGAKSWKNYQLLNTDLVHFTKKGYVLQADLFVSAFIKTWNEFLAKN